MAEGEKIIGIDLGTTNSVVAVMEGSEPKVIPECGRQPFNAQCRRLHGERRSAGGRTGTSTGRHEPDADGLLGQAFHGTSAQRSGHRREDGAVQGRRAARATT